LNINPGNGELKAYNTEATVIPKVDTELKEGG
jgi:hypothetical protein